MWVTDDKRRAIFIYSSSAPATTPALRLPLLLYLAAPCPGLLAMHVQHALCATNRGRRRWLLSLQAHLRTRSSSLHVQHVVKVHEYCPFASLVMSSWTHGLSRKAMFTSLVYMAQGSGSVSRLWQFTGQWPRDALHGCLLGARDKRASEDKCGSLSQISRSKRRTLG